MFWEASDSALGPLGALQLQQKDSPDETSTIIPTVRLI